MKPIVTGVYDQVLATLREEIRSRRWRGRLPGVRPLSSELGVAPKTVAKALAELEKEGLVGPREAGKMRKVVVRETSSRRAATRETKVGIFLMRRAEEECADVRSLILSLIGDLQDRGHRCTIVYFPPGVDQEKTGKLASITGVAGVDVWIVYRGTVGVLEWFSKRRLPTLNFAGPGVGGLPVAACDAMGAMREVVRGLARSGHRRIVCLAPPRVQTFARDIVTGEYAAFRDALTELGIPVGEYNIPRWDGTSAGLRALLDSLFRVTPPTALVCLDNLYATGVLTFCAERRLRLPEDVSLFVTDDESTFAWQFPGIDVTRYVDHRDVTLKRTLDWVDRAAKGVVGTESLWVEAGIHKGNTIGPPRGE